MKNVSLQYKGSLKKVSLAVNKANEILNSEEFYNQIRAYRKFDNSTLSPEVISRLMQDSGHKIEVSVNWIVPIANPRHDKIHVSGWDFSPVMGTGVNNLIYETVHCIDCLYEALHKNGMQRKSANLTAPWVIGAIAELMAKETGISNYKPVA